MGELGPICEMVRTGRVVLSKDSYGYFSTPETDRSILVEVFRDGKLLAETTFSEMRDRVKL